MIIILLENCDVMPVVALIVELEIILVNLECIDMLSGGDVYHDF